jgi:hypothetical protein
MSSPSRLCCSLGLFWSSYRCGTDNLLKTGSFMFRPIQFVWWHKTAHPIQPTAAQRRKLPGGQQIDRDYTAGRYRTSATIYYHRARGVSSPRTRVIRQDQYASWRVTLLRNFPRARVPRTSGILRYASSRSTHDAGLRSAGAWVCTLHRGARCVCA